MLKNLNMAFINLKIENTKSTIRVYFILRFLVIICMIMACIRGNFGNAFICLLSLILFCIPIFIKKKLKIEMPNTFEIIILLFIFAAEILGEINNFYSIIPHWDTILHTINGFLVAAVGFSLIDLLNKNVKSINLSPFFVALVSFCFSMTIGVMWEFFEYTFDRYIMNTDMQKDFIVTKISSISLNEERINIPVIIKNIKYTIIYSEDEKGILTTTLINNGYLDIGLYDTMKDLFVNFIGAVCFSTFGYLYITKEDKFNFINHFVLKKQIEDN